MPYGYGGANGPADWAAQQQDRQADNFNQIIRLFLSLKQAQQEEGWKQKEFGANQQRYDNSLAQQGVENKRAEAMFGLTKQDRETDNARQAARDASLEKGAAETREQNKWYREETIAERKARAAREAKQDSDALGERANRDKISRQIGLLTARAKRIAAERTSTEKAMAQGTKMATLFSGGDPAKLAAMLAPHQSKLDAYDAEAKDIEQKYAALVGGYALPDEEEKRLRGDAPANPPVGQKSPKAKVKAGEEVAKGEKSEFYVVRNGAWVLAEY